MTTRIVSLTLIAALCIAQAPAPQPPDTAATTIRGGRQEVLLDIIVRDKKGKLVRDLKPDEIKITDEGQPQQIVDFRMVETDTPASVLPGQAAGPQAQKAALDPL